SQSLNALLSVNKRVYNFFQCGGEIQGLFIKIPFKRLIIQKVSDDSVGFFFDQKLMHDEWKKDDGDHTSMDAHESAPWDFTRVFNLNGLDVTRNFPRYSRRHLPINDNSEEARVSIPDAFYHSLECAMQKYFFSKLKMRSV
ncbi:hypothetical protein PMAYCL1PPCAC_10281, partial [Pristionchus mayeri]